MSQKVRVKNDIRWKIGVKNDMSQKKGVKNLNHSKNRGLKCYKMRNRSKKCYESNSGDWQWRAVRRKKKKLHSINRCHYRRWLIFLRIFGRRKVWIFEFDIYVSFVIFELLYSWKIKKNDKKFYRFVKNMDTDKTSLSYVLLI